jgi:hypothetical protein
MNSNGTFRMGILRFLLGCTQNNLSETNTPPAESDRCPIDGGSFYEVRIDVEDMTPGLTVNLWAIQYDRSERLTHVNMQLAPGENRLPFRANPDARGLRVALRLAGNGHCVLGDPHLYSIR